MAEQLEDAIEELGGKAALAKLLGVTRAAVCQWTAKPTGIPAKRVLDVERVTGVSRHKLRPDIFGDQPQKVA